MSGPEPQCYTDFALQEYAQGRLDADVRRSVMEHTGACAECRAALQDFDNEAALLRETLRSLTLDSAGVEELSDEMLARYSGGGMPPEESARIDSILSQDPSALKRLILLMVETRAARSDSPSETDAIRSQPAGEILRMPKRIARAVTIDVGRKASGGQAG